GYVAATVLRLTGRADQDLVLDREGRRGMSRADRQPIARADVEDDLSGILVERNETRVGAAATGIDVHLVAEQRDAMQALGASLHLGIIFPDQFGLLVSDVEFPVPLVLVAHIHEAVLDE